VLVQGSLDWCRCYGALGRRAAALREICILAPSATLETQHNQARNNSGGSVIRCYFLNEFSCDIIKRKGGMKAQVCL